MKYWLTRCQELEQRARRYIFITLQTGDNVSSQSGENDFAEFKQLYRDDWEVQSMIFKETVNTDIPKTIKT